MPHLSTWITARELLQEYGYDPEERLTVDNGSRVGERFLRSDACCSEQGWYLFD